MPSAAVIVAGMGSPRSPTSGSRYMVVTDAVVAAVCVVVFWLPYSGRADWLGPLHLTLIATVVAGLLIHRRWPVAAFGAVAATTLLGAVQSYTLDPFVAAAWILFTVSTTRLSSRLSPVSAVVAGLLVIAFAMVGGVNVADIVRYVLMSLVVTAGAWTLGSSTVRQREEAAHATRAERERALVAERLRIAREIHDVVSHALGTIAVTSSVGAHVAAGDAQRLQARLNDVAAISGRALDELRGALAAVRSPDDAVELRPLPGLDDLAELVGTAEKAGLAVQLSITGDIPGIVGLAVYRIVQEGLTNAVRHAPGARCTVTVIGSVDEVHVQVDDNGSVEGSATGTGGVGLIGLRERVELLGGSLWAGPRPGGGFGLDATIPVTAIAR